MGDVDIVYVRGYVDHVAAGYRAAAFTAVFGGIPLALLAVGVLLATWRRARPWPTPATAAFRFAFVLECGACLCSAVFLAIAAWAAPSAAAFFAEPVLLLLIATLLASAASFPAWRTAMLAAAPDRPPSVVTGRPR